MAKSQVTIYIILGIVILMTLLFLIFNSIDTFTIKNGFGLNSEALPLENYFSECLKKATKDTADFISLQGGYYDKPLNFINSGSIIKIPYYYTYDKKDDYPTTTFLKEELNKGVNKNFFKCIDNSLVIDKLGFTIKPKSKPIFNFMINNQEITTNLEYKIELSKDEKAIFIEKFISKIKHPLFELHKNSIKLVQEIKKDLEIIPTSYLIDFSLNNDIYTEVFDLRNGDVLYSLIRNKNTSNEIIYNFAIEQKRKIKNERKLEFNSTLNFNIPAGYLFQTKISTNIPNSNYTSYTDLFNMSINGEINFTPENTNTGLNYILIKAENKNSKIFSFLTLNITGYNSPKIENILSQTIQKNNKFQYQVNLTEKSNEKIFYFASGTLNESINLLTGFIDYEAKKTLEEIINITVVDINGNIDVEDFKLKVIE
jgi:hypothetical protein